MPAAAGVALNPPNQQTGGSAGESGGAQGQIRTGPSPAHGPNQVIPAGPVVVGNQGLIGVNAQAPVWNGTEWVAEPLVVTWTACTIGPKMKQGARTVAARLVGFNANPTHVELRGELAINAAKEETVAGGTILTLPAGNFRQTTEEFAMVLPVTTNAGFATLTVSGALSGILSINVAVKTAGVETISLDGLRWPMF